MKRLWASALLTAVCLITQAQGALQTYDCGTLYSYGNSFNLYPEGFVRHKGQKLLINGKSRLSVGKGITQETITLSDQDGLSSVATVRIVCTEPEDLSMGRQATVLCIGESTTGTVNPNPWNGSFGKGWNWVSMMKVKSMEHGTDIVCLGTDTIAEAPLEASYTAHGGWSSYTYLNWPCAAKMDPGAPKHFFNSETMWYALGLSGLTGKEYSGESWQFDMMAGTPFGKYPVDEHPSLLEFARLVGGRYGYPVFEGNIRDWALRLAGNPINEFYSLDAARNGSTAFSLDAYLERYRTMDDRGNRLETPDSKPAGKEVRGRDGKIYRIGTRIVSQELLKKVSVCRPGYVVVNIGINDGDSTTSVEAAASSMERLLESFPDIPVAHFVMRWPGACDPGLWAPAYRTFPYSVGGNGERVMSIMPALAGRMDGTHDITLLDVWHCQSPVSQHQEEYSGGTLDCSVNDVHTGYEGQMDAASQVLGWLYYRLD